jgi:hypothetical protein
MNINILDGEKYIPTLFNNDKDPAPITFNLKYLTVKDQDEIEYYEVVQGKKNTVNLKANWRDIFFRGVGSIENLMINDKEIKDAESYLAIRGSKKLTDLMHDVAMKIKTASEIDEKN